MVKNMRWFLFFDYEGVAGAQPCGQAVGVEVIKNLGGTMDIAFVWGLGNLSNNQNNQGKIYALW